MLIFAVLLAMMGASESLKDLSFNLNYLHVQVADSGYLVLAKITQLYVDLSETNFVEWNL